MLNTKQTSTLYERRTLGISSVGAFSRAHRRFGGEDETVFGTMPATVLATVLATALATIQRATRFKAAEHIVAAGFRLFDRQIWSRGTETPKESILTR